MDGIKSAASVAASNVVSGRENQVKQDKAAGMQVGPDYQVSLGNEPQKTGVYTKPVVNEAVTKLKQEATERYDRLRDLVQKLITEQGKMTDIDYVKLESDIRSQAAQDVGDGGYFSPEETAKRIVEFAKTISDGDANKAGLLRNAIEKGFGEASKMLGGELPEISQRTYELVMSEMDKWQQEAQAQAAAPTDATKV